MFRLVRLTHGGYESPGSQRNPRAGRFARAGRFWQTARVAIAAGDRNAVLQTVLFGVRLGQDVLLFW